MTETNFPERRQNKRIQKHFILHYHDVNTPDHKFSATQLKNISKGGICLFTEQGFPPGTILEIEIKSAFFSNVMRLQGEVLESRERLKNIIYETRLKFKDISAETEAVILKCIEFFENKENGHA